MDVVASHSSAKELLVVVPADLSACSLQQSCLVLRPVADDVGCNNKMGPQAVAADNNNKEQWDRMDREKNSNA